MTRYDDTVDNRSFKEKMERFSYDVKMKMDRFGNWCKQNPQFAVSLGIGVLSAAVGIAKTAARSAETKEIKQRRLRSVYDRSKGHYYDMKRIPKPKEWEEIDRRKDDGESYGEILRDMNLI